MSKVATVAKKAASVGVGFWEGFSFPFKGMKFVYFDHPKLARFWIFPILITLITLCLGSWASWHYSADIIDSFWAAPEGDGFFDGVARFFHGFFEILLSIALWAVSIIFLMLLTSVIAAPFNGALSAAVEEIATGKGNAEGGFGVFMRDIGRTVVLEIMKLLIYLMVMVPLFALQCAVPAVGTVFYSIFGFTFTAWFWGLDYVDWPAERRGWPVGQRFTTARKRFMTMFGFGAGVWMFVFIPFVNLFFMPAAVAGGTLLFLEMEGPAPDPTAPPEPVDPVGDPSAAPGPPDELPPRP